MRFSNWPNMRYHQYYKILDEQIIPDKEVSDVSDVILISCKISSSLVITIPAPGQPLSNLVM